MARPAQSILGNYDTGAVSNERAVLPATAIPYPPNKIIRPQEKPLLEPQQPYRNERDAGI